jgi:hypothetical protein
LEISTRRNTVKAFRKTGLALSERSESKGEVAEWLKAAVC